MNRVASYTIILFVLFFVSITNDVTAGGITVLHTFGDLDDGAKCGGFDCLTSSGSTLYGVTISGGAYGAGTVFAAQLDGSEYRSYSLPNPSGQYSQGIVVDDSMIYATNLAGGTASRGAVYSMKTDGTDFGLLHSFTGLDGDGESVYSGLAMTGTRLYGTTVLGGIDDNGVLYSMNKDGSDYRILHAFTDGSDGTRPYYTPTIDGSVLYGSSEGSLYKMNTDGTDYQVLRSGIYGVSDLLLNGSTLYGISTGFRIFSISTDGSDYQALYELDFPGGYSGLALVDSTLYGMCRYNGTAGKGLIYSVNTDGTDYKVLYNFLGGDDGAEPIGAPIIIGSTLYGTTFKGGTYDDGILFSMTIPEPSTFTLLFVGAAALLVFFCFPKRWRNV